MRGKAASARMTVLPPRPGRVARGRTGRRIERRTPPDFTYPRSSSAAPADRAGSRPLASAVALGKYIYAPGVGAWCQSQQARLLTETDRPPVGSDTRKQFILSHLTFN